MCNRGGNRETDRKKISEQERGTERQIEIEPQRTRKKRAMTHRETNRQRECMHV